MIEPRTIGFYALILEADHAKLKSYAALAGTNMRIEFIKWIRSLSFEDLKQ